MKLVMRILTILCFAFIAYVHVWQRVQVLRVGYKISQNENRKKELTKEYRALWLEFSKLESVGRIENLSEMELLLKDSEELKIVELVSPD